MSARSFARMLGALAFLAEGGPKYPNLRYEPIKRKKRRINGRRKRRLKAVAKMRQVLTPIPDQRDIGARKICRKFR